MKKVRNLNNHIDATIIQNIPYNSHKEIEIMKCKTCAVKYEKYQQG